MALFREYPYLLPCLTASIISLLTCIIAFLGLKETHPSLVLTKKLDIDTERSRESDIPRTSSTDTLVLPSASSTDTLLNKSDIPRVSSTDTLLLRADDSIPDYGSTSSTRCPSPVPSEASMDPYQQKLADTDTEPSPPTLRSVLGSRKMQSIIMGYVFVMFTDMCFNVLTPLVFSTSIKDGGLGLTPYQIGLTMGVWGFFNAFVQINVLGRAIRKYGGTAVYRATYMGYIVCFLAYPVSTYLARRNGSVGFASWVIIVIQFFFQIVSNMSFGAILVTIAESSPKPLLGSINGVVQMTGCMMRFIAPTFASSLFSISMEDQILGGDLVYVILCFIVLIGTGFSRTLTDRRKPQGKSY